MPLDSQVNLLERLDDTGNTWVVQQNNATNAYYVTIPTGSVNNNNKNNAYAAVPVTDSVIDVDELLLAEEDCFSTKKRRFDAAYYHYNISDVYKLADEINCGIYRPRESTCFVLDRPKYREVFAANYRDRVVHHLVASYISSICEMVHRRNGDVSHGNRRNHSSVEGAKKIQVAMQNHKDGYVASMDISGFFMSINRDVASRIFDKYALEYGVGYEKYRWIVDILIKSDPTINCIRNSPIEMWSKIEKNKTLFGNSGNGMPIGNFYSQLVANLVLAVLDEEMIKRCKHYTRFVDDFVVVGDSAEGIQNAREIAENRLCEIGLKLHPRKFYIQPVSHGVKFCGRVVYHNRMYVINRVVRSARNTIRRALISGCTENNAKCLMRSINAYTGLMSFCNSFNVQRELMERILCSGFREWLYFENRNGHLVCQLYDYYKDVNEEMKVIDNLLKQYRYERKRKNFSWRNKYAKAK